MKSLMTVCVVVSLMLAAGTEAQDSQVIGSPPIAPAGVLPLDGTWVQFSENMVAPAFFTGLAGSPWTWNSTQWVKFTITDWAVVSDQFSVYDGGGFVLTTPAMSDWDVLLLADPFTSPPWTANPATALADGRFSSAVHFFAPGAHSITIEDIHIPPTAAGGVFIDGTAAIKAEASVVGEIDIKPGSCPNPFNPKSKGSVPVAIIGTADFDVTTIDIEIVALSLVSPSGVSVPMIPGSAVFKDSTQPSDSDPTDCDDCFDAEANFNCDLDGDGEDDAYCGDGILDLVVKFDTQALAAAIGRAERNDCVELVLIGQTLAGDPIVASDSMVILKKITP